MAKLYKVDEITERTRIDTQGKPNKIYRVVATSQSGTKFTVEIPEPDFTKEKVGQILTEKAELIEGIIKL